MTRPFAVLVTGADRIERPSAGIVIAGPTIGIEPAAAVRLVVEQRFASSLEARYLGRAHFNRGDRPNESRAIIDAPVSDPRSLIDAVVHEEGATLSRFPLRLGASIGPVLAAARFDLRDRTAFGFVRADGRLLDAFVVGDALDKRSFWRELTLIATPEGLEISKADLVPPIAIDPSGPASHARVPPPFPHLRSVDKLAS